MEMYNNANIEEYAGLFKYREVLEHLCSAILLRAVLDRMTLERKKDYRFSEYFDTPESLDRWFKSQYCHDLCSVVEILPAFDSVDWKALKAPGNSRYRITSE